MLSFSFWLQICQSGTLMAPAPISQRVQTVTCTWSHQPCSGIHSAKTPTSWCCVRCWSTTANLPVGGSVSVCPHKSDTHTHNLPVLTCIWWKPIHAWGVNIGLVWFTLGPIFIGRSANTHTCVGITHKSTVAKASLFKGLYTFDHIDCIYCTSVIVGDQWVAQHCLLAVRRIWVQSLAKALWDCPVWSWHVLSVSSIGVDHRRQLEHPEKSPDE